MRKGTKSGLSKDDLITQAEAARLRRLSRAAIHALVKRGRLKSRKISGRVMVYRSEVLKFQKSKSGPKLGVAGST